MASGFVGVLTCELHFPFAHSLKEKRHHLRSAKAQLQNRVGASVAEVDHHDVWQRARITVACVAREHRAECVAVRVLVRDDEKAVVVAQRGRNRLKISRAPNHHLVRARR